MTWKWKKNWPGEQKEAITDESARNGRIAGNSKDMLRVLCIWIIANICLMLYTKNIFIIFLSFQVS